MRPERDGMPAQSRRWGEGSLKADRKAVAGEEGLNSKHEALLSLIEKRTGNMLLTRQSLCAEAVLTVLNQGLGGGLPPDLTARLVSGLPEGLII